MLLPVAKSKKIHILKLVPNPDNDRFMPGTKVAGMEMPDTLNLGVMDMVIMQEIPGIKAAGEMPEPLKVVDNGDGTFLVGQGNRRTLSGQRIYNDPKCPADVKKALEGVDCIVYPGPLSKEQLNYLVHDKKSQTLNRSEILAQVWKRQAMGESFSDIAMELYPLLGNYTGQGQIKLREVSAITDPAARKTAILKWLRGTLDLKMLAAGLLGDRVKLSFMIIELKNDSLIPETVQPEFSPRQERLQELKKIKESESDVWTAKDGSPLFNAKIDEFHAHDYPSVNPLTGEPEKPAEPELKKRSVDDLTKQQKNFTQSATMKLAYEFAKGGTPTTLLEVDAKCFLWESITESLIKNAANLPEPLHIFAKHLTDGTDPATFVGWLESLCAKK